MDRFPALSGVCVGGREHPRNKSSGLGGAAGPLSHQEPLFDGQETCGSGQNKPAEPLRFLSKIKVF